MHPVLAYSNAGFFVDVIKAIATNVIVFPKRGIYIGVLCGALITRERDGILTRWHQLPLNQP